TVRSVVDESVELTPRTGGVSVNREIKELAEILDTFLEVNQDLVLDDVLELVLTRSIEFTGADRGVILLARHIEEDVVDPSLERIVPKISGDLRPAMALDRLGVSLPLDEHAISQKIPIRVLESGVGVVLEDLLSDEDAEMHVDTIDLGVRSAMCVPLKARRPGSGPDESPEPIGVLYVDSRTLARPYSSTLLHALESLAGEAARAISNAQLYRISQIKRQIDEEMKLARSIQENLHPPATCDRDWFALKGTSQASLEVGGDVINYFVREDRLGLLVGDVSGKGVGAAIFSAMLDGHFWSLSARDTLEAELGPIAEDLNRYLTEKSQGQKFVSLVCGVLRKQGELTYVNAGHNPPLLVKSDSELSELKDGGMIMGLFDDANYEVGHVVLEPGDRLILYSDGIPEARNYEGEFYGMERLRRIVSESGDASPESIHEAVIESLESFVAGRPLSDDVTLLVLGLC
ncbi:MAG: GAF domain-containing SpoIIE family protein phosphatase, partial [Planctomycetota bacterium]